jgi:hypothetical protein
MSKQSLFHFSTPAWVSQTRSWLAEGARFRADAEAVSRIDAAELRDLGFSHAAAARREIALTDRDSAGERNWIHATPRFPGRVAQQATP